MTTLRHATGFDGGSTHLCSVSAQRLDDKVRIRNVAFMETLNPAEDPDFRLTFDEFCRKEKASRSNLVAGLSGRSVMVRYLKLPIVPDWKLEMMMDYELNEQSSKFSLDSYSDYRKVDIPGIRKYNVMMIGVCHKELVDYYIESIPRIKMFNFNSLGLYAASLLRGDLDPEKTVALVDVGAQNTEVVIVQGDALLFARNIQYGGNNFSEDLVTACNLDFADADRVKAESGRVLSRNSKQGDTSSDEELQKLNDALTSSARIFATQISSAVQYAREQIRAVDFEVDEFLTTGGGSQLEGLNEFLSEKLETPVSHLDIMGRLDLEPLSAAKAEHLRDNIHACTTAIGLAVSGIDSRCAVLNPMPLSVQKKRRFLHHELQLIIAAVLFLVALINWGSYMISQNTALEEDLQNRESLLHDAQTLEKKIDQEELVYSRFQDMEKSIQERVFSSTDMLQIFKALQESLPEDIWITSFYTENLSTAEQAEGTVTKSPTETVESLGRGAVYISGQVRIKNGTDPHQLLDDYTERLKRDHPRFDRFEPKEKKYSDNMKKEKFYFTYKIYIANSDV